MNEIPPPIHLQLLHTTSQSVASYTIANPKVLLIAANLVFSKKKLSQTSAKNDVK